MAEKLNKTGLQYFYNRIKTIFAKQVDLTDLEDKVDDIIAEGGEPNVIEIVKRNGTALTPDANKAVNVEVPEDLSDLTNTAQDPYMKESDVDSKVVGALKPKGSVAFASLPALTAANLNNMYNVTDAFTTTADFVEGAGKAYPAGTNVAIINTGSDASPVYKYDAMPGVIDMSGYWSKAELVDITTAEIDAIIDGNSGS